MNTVDGYAISSWERGYGDMEFVPDWSTLRLLPHLPGDGDGAVRPGLARPRARCSSRRARSCGASSTGSPRRAWSALAGTELEFIAFDDVVRGLPRPRAGATSRRSTSTTSTTRSSAPAGSSRCCATSATTCTPPGSTSRAPRASATSASTRSASSTPTPRAPPTTTASTRPPPRRSRPSAARRSPSWRSTTSARATPATSTCRCAATTATSCSGTATSAPRSTTIHRRRAGDAARVHAALRAEHQLLQAVRGRLVRADRRRVGAATTAPARSGWSATARAPGWRTGCPAAT